MKELEEKCLKFVVEHYKPGRLNTSEALRKVKGEVVQPVGHSSSHRHLSRHIHLYEDSGGRHRQTNSRCDDGTIRAA
jgi:hypothetical protein